MRNLKTSDPVQGYLKTLFPEEPMGVAEARRNAEQLHKEGISLSHSESQLISFLVRNFDCRKFVEIGTLTGASGLWILQGLATGGTLWTCEMDPKHVALAKPLLETQAQSQNKRCLILEGDAKKTIQTIQSEGPFDGILIDGNKGAYGRYLDWADANLKKGGLLILDNVFLGGSVWGEESASFSDKQTKVMQEVNRRLADSSRYDSVLVPTHEGLFVAVKKF